MQHAKVFARASLLLCLAVVLPNCASLYMLALNTTGFEKIDVTEQEEYWGGFDPGTIYVLKRNAYILHDDDMWKTKTNHALIAHSAKELVPASHEDYLRETGRSKPDVKGYVPKGTKLGIYSITFFKYPDNGGLIEICGYIVDENAKLKKYVYIDDLGDHKENDKGILLLYPREDVLEIDQTREH